MLHVKEPDQANTITAIKIRPAEVMFDASETIDNLYQFVACHF
jgi:hypothetical protein